VILIYTLGFEEKYVLRGIINRGIKPEDKIWIIIPKPRNERTDVALNNLRTIAGKLYGVKIEDFEVPIDDVYEAVSTLRSFFKERMREDKIALNLSGGMKILVLAVLAAVNSLNMECEIDILREDLAKYYTFPIELFRSMGLDDVDRRILKALMNNAKGVSEVARSIGVSKSTVWRRLEILARKGLVEKKDKRYVITGLGRSRI